MEHYSPSICHICYDLKKGEWKETQMEAQYTMRNVKINKVKEDICDK